jgi:hypothetical protein
MEALQAMPLAVQVEAKTREKVRLTCYQFSTTMIMIRMPNSNATLSVARCFHWVQLNQRHTRILLASAPSMATKVPQCACSCLPLVVLESSTHKEKELSNVEVTRLFCSQNRLATFARRHYRTNVCSSCQFASC